VALLARRAERLDEIVHDITVAGGTAIAVPVDLTDASTLMSGHPGLRERGGVEQGRGRPARFDTACGGTLAGPVRRAPDRRAG
jgi:hypothetical protein